MPADGAAACKHQMVNVEQRPKSTSIWLVEAVDGWVDSPFQTVAPLWNAGITPYFNTKREVVFSK